MDDTTREKMIKCLKLLGYDDADGPGGLTVDEATKICVEALETRLEKECE